ncbi:hypothetical protein E1B28_010950 [Marasmius oreades]|uniref:Uncharacterized protein n=1 Tax=Marasmius oreades TaxID=181124 RepID=A0A9P7UQP7_9AGAR|nr:uncharacterized protein E1B28_010950 [Marasmius oreades]KAG7089251.1 hypothetical protein E1B28_010950 [Marasmius oreades]
MPVFHPESSISAVPEDISAPSNESGSLMVEFLVLGGLVFTAAVAAKMWFYPYTIEDLEGRVRAVDTLIRDNTNLHLDILGDSATRFRRVLER